jgi:hypothetical protein
MNVLNIHECKFCASRQRVGALIDSLASPGDALWPRHSWPRMELDRPLAVGAVGGHGPVGYLVEDYAPGRSIRFRFTRPKGWEGWHGFAIVSADESGTVLRQTLQMKVRIPALPMWLCFFRPLHDAVIADSFTTAEASLGLEPRLRPWSWWVRGLVWILSGGRAKKQNRPR